MDTAPTRQPATATVALNYACHAQLHSRWSRLAIGAFVMGMGSTAVIVLHILPLMALDYLWGRVDPLRTAMLAGLALALPLIAMAMGFKSLDRIRRHPQLRGEALADWAAFLGSLWLMLYAGVIIIIALLRCGWVWL